jgi:hypothetical protein
MRPEGMSLQDLAVSRLRTLFPGWKLVRDLDRQSAQAAAERVAKLTHSSRKACPFPGVKDTGLVQRSSRRRDGRSTASRRPCSGTKMIPQPRSPQLRAHLSARMTFTTE